MADSRKFYTIKEGNARGLGGRKTATPIKLWISTFITVYPPALSLPGKVDESSFYISPYQLNANSISDIKTLNSSYQLSFHRRGKETKPDSIF